MIAEVIVDISNSDVDKVFDYIATDGVMPGHRVLVPFGRQRPEGVVLKLKERPDTNHTLRAIERILDPEPLILPEFLELAEFMRKKNLRYADCFRLFMPARLRGGSIRELKRNYLFINSERDFESEYAKLSVRAVAQRALFKELSAGALRESEVLERYSAAAVKALIDKNLIIKKALRTLRVPGGMNISAEKQIIEQLIKGPSGENALPTLPEDTKLLGVSVRDGVCYVNFSEEFLQPVDQVDPKLTIYSIVNSITASGSAGKVQILVNGETNLSYQETIDISQPFSMNADLIEEEE